MTYYTIPPSHLSNYVRCFWVLEGGAGSYTHRSMADGCAEIVFHYKAVFDRAVK